MTCSACMEMTTPNQNYSKIVASIILNEMKGDVGIADD